MRIQIRERNVKVTEDLRAHVEGRLGFALGRFGDRIGRVMVRFSGNGAEGGSLDQRCRIEVDLRPRSVMVEDRDVDLFAAVDHAARRVARSVARALELEVERA